MFFPFLGKGIKTTVFPAGSHIHENSTGISEDAEVSTEIGLCIWILNSSLFAVYCCAKYMTKGSLGRNGFISSSFQVTVMTENIMAGAGGGNRSIDHEEMCSLPLSNLSHTTDHLPRDGTASSGVGRPTSSNQENAPETCLRAKMTESFKILIFNLEVPFSLMTLVSKWQKTNQHKSRKKNNFQENTELTCAKLTEYEFK